MIVNLKFVYFNCNNDSSICPNAALVLEGEGVPGLGGQGSYGQDHFNCGEGGSHYPGTLWAQHSHPKRDARAQDHQGRNHGGQAYRVRTHCFTKENRLEDAIASLIKKSVDGTNKYAGDGTTTSTVLIG